MQAMKLIVPLALIAAFCGCGEKSNGADSGPAPAAGVSKPGSASSADTVEGKPGGRAAESTDPNVPAGR